MNEDVEWPGLGINRYAQAVKKLQYQDWSSSSIQHSLAATLAINIRLSWILNSNTVHPRLAPIKN